MGKVKKQRRRLHEQISYDQQAQPSGKIRKEKAEAEDAKFVDEKLSRKILAEARKQSKDVEHEQDGSMGAQAKANKKRPLPKQHLGGASAVDSDSEDEQTNKHLFDSFAHLEKAVLEINDEDEDDLRKFMNPNPKQKRTLGDIIREKLEEKKTEMTEVLTDIPVDEDLPDEMRTFMVKVGEVLSHYRSGPIPKGFKAIPVYSNWQQLLELTRPENWTAASVYIATKVFVSNLPKTHYMDFCTLVLLPRIRDDIAEYKRLNFHLYQALMKSLYKPGDFFQGIVLSLCEAGDCTLREATIVAGVISQNSIPMGYSAAALIMIARMEYNGANSIFMRALLNKKYSLPYSAIDAVVEHFVRFISVEEQLPVLWHQCLLTLVQRYKHELTPQQKSELLQLLRCHEHREITPEIRREITQSKRSRGDPPLEEEDEEMAT